MVALRTAVRFFLFGLVTAFVVGSQTIILRFYRGRWSYVIPQFFQCSVRRIFGIKVIVEGKPVKGRQTLYISNHLSYFDIPLLGTFLPHSFVARGDLAAWPLFGYMSKMQQTVFISRDRKDAAKGKEQLDKLLAEGKSLIIFAEGTSTDGAQVLPFKSSLFSLALENPTGKPLMVQPITISLLSVDGRPATSQEVRDLYAWHGDMTLPPHIRAFARLKGAELKVKFHPPRDAADYTNRKLLTHDCYNDVAGSLEIVAQQAQAA